MFDYWEYFSDWGAYETFHLRERERVLNGNISLLLKLFEILKNMNVDENMYEYEYDG